jgi:hypothetical protein
MIERHAAPPAASASLATSPPPAAGRLAILALLGGAAGAIPLPFVPGSFLRRVRGAVVHDVASRRGLTLTEEARQVLAEASGAGGRGRLAETFAFVARRTLRRFRLLGALPPVASWIEVYALGLLFDRYLAQVRHAGPVRISWAEAGQARTLIDAAVARSFSPALRADFGPSREGLVPPEELRDTATRFSDGLLLALATVPARLRARLEAAFDAIAAERHG